MLKSTETQIERTIRYLSRKLRNTEDPDQKDVVALSRLIKSFAVLMERNREEELDPFEYGDPGFHASLEEGTGEARRRREREAAEKLGIDPDTLEDDDPDDDDDDDENGDNDDD